MLHVLLAVFFVGIYVMLILLAAHLAAVHGQTIKFANSTLGLPWQHWTKALVWFDYVDIPVFHSCVVDLWQSLSEWHLLLTVCVCFGVPPRECLS
jgi:hypothetical protein